EPVAITVEILRGGAYDRESVMRVADRQRNDPGDIRVLRELLVTRPLHVGRGFADPEHGVEHQLHRAGPRADHEVRAGDGVREALVRGIARALDAEKHRDAEGD